MPRTTDRGRARGLVRAVPQAVALLLLAACTSTVVGTASPAQAPGPPPTPAVTPTGTPPAAGPAVAPPPLTPGPQVEAIRMAAATSLVTVASPDRTEYCDPSGPFVEAAALEERAFAPGAALPALREHGSSRRGRSAAWTPRAARRWR